MKRIRTKMFLYDWKQNCVFYAVEILFSWIELFFFCNQDIVLYSYGSYCSKADYFIRLMRPTAYSILNLIFVIFAAYQSIKNDFNVQRIIRFKSKKDLVHFQEIKLIFISLLFTITYAIGIFTISMTEVSTLINWDRADSVYWLETQTVIANITFEKVILFFVVITFIRNFLFANIIVLSSWIFRNRIIGVLAVFAIIVFEIRQASVKVLLWLFTLDYPVWESSMRKMEMVIGIICYAIIGFIVIKKLCRSKEFIGER